MAVPVRHRACGEIAMWYMGERGDSRLSSENIVYLDGTRPAVYSAIPKCPHCGRSMFPGRDLVRCFDEDVDPGFDVQEAWRSGERVNPQSWAQSVSDPVVVAKPTQKQIDAKWVFIIALAIWLLAMVIVVVMK